MLRKNSETLKPAALAFSSTLRYSAADILSLTILDLRSDFAFGGRPMRFFILSPILVFGIQKVKPYFRIFCFSTHPRKSSGSKSMGDRGVC